MKAFFADIKETGLMPDRGPEAWGAQAQLPSEAQQHRLDELDEKLAEYLVEGAHVAHRVRARRPAHR